MPPGRSGGSRSRSRKRPRGGGAWAAGGASMDGAAAAAAEVSEPAGEPYRRLQDAIKRTTAPPKKGADGGAGGEGEGPGAIDPACWAELKQLLKGGPEEAAAQAFTLLLGQLRDRRIGVRARALALLDRLVQRSAAVRRRALDQLRDVLDLTVGGSGRAKLPPPAAEAARLRAQALGCLEEWHARYAGEHPGVRVAYLHLKEGAGVVLPDNQARREEARRAAEAHKAERARSLRARYLAHRGAMRQGLEELRGVLDQMQACFDIVVPDMRMGLEALGEAPSAAAAVAADAAVGKAGEGGHGQEGDDDDDVEWESGDEGGGVGHDAAGAVSWENFDADELLDDDDDDADGGGGGEDDDLFGLGNAPFYEIEVELPWLNKPGGGGGGGGDADGGHGDGNAGGTLETVDVKPVFDQLRELYRVLKGRLLPQAEQWWRLLACAQGLLQEEEGQEQQAAAAAAASGQYPHHESDAALLPECRRLLREMGALRARALRTVEQCAELRTVVTERRAERRQQQQEQAQGKGKAKGKGVESAVAPPAATVDLELFLQEGQQQGTGAEEDGGSAKRTKKK